MKSTIQAVLHLHQFSNIDLSMQGIYQLKVSIYEKEISQPYQILKSQNGQNITHNSGLVDLQYISRSEIRDQEFFSKGFLIRFCDEVIELDDICVFRIQLNPYAKSSQLILQVDLLHSDLAYAMDENINKIELQNQMQICSTYQARINEFENISEHFQIEFQRHHFGLVDASIHTLPIDISYDKLETLNEQNRINQIYLDSVIFLKKMHIKFTTFLNQKFNQTLEQIYDQTELFNEIKQHCNFYQPFYIISRILLKNQRSRLNQELSLRINYEQIDQSGSFQEFPIMVSLPKLFSSKQGRLISYYEDNYMIVYEQCQQPSKLKQKEKWCENIFQQLFQCDDLFCGSNDVEKHKTLFKQIRENSNNQELKQTLRLPIENIINESNSPIMFNDVYYKKDQVTKQYTLELHLIILVNGFQGSQQDMNQWQSYIKVYYPKLLILISEANEGAKTNDDIDIQGQRLADEVIEFIRDWTTKDGFGKLSFIGHSLGGIIIRAALPYLEQYKDKMCFLGTLGSPHLGYMNNKNKLIGTGIWFMKKMNKCTSLNQLTMGDKKEQEQKFMYVLSQKYNLEWFNTIGLVSSIQDQYAPYESARIQCGDKQYEKMGRELLKNCQKIVRIDVNFPLEGTSVDNMIGRSAHIKMLDNVSFIRMFLMCFQDILS